MTDKDKEERQRASEAFDIARSQAINTFADLERSMVQLFSTLLGAAIKNHLLYLAR